ncbi:hypothetical protein RHGRI_018294 [Rhododendron griersonianum]|uniref:Bulb-type lectin domain-containing protein n=1 Tax=Rhododendron griersonianum TaxID=479676 RepID=A0AAV6K0W9_9ERIC|nr:hypothetical protein RHGRI_018294 [Rhododendron griersonianum]
MASTNSEHKCRMPQVLWSVNRNGQVGENATLDFTAAGDKVSRDGFGSPVWSTSASIDYVALGWKIRQELPRGFHISTRSVMRV